MAEASTQNLFSTLEGITTILSEAAGWVQIGMIIIAGIGAWTVNRYFGHHLASARDEQREGLRRITLGSGALLLFPFVFLLLLLAGQAAVQGLGYNDQLLAVAVPLLLSLAIIRLALYLMRKSIAPGPMLKAWENTLTTLIWIAVALHLFGWLTPLVEALDSISITTGEDRFSLWSIIKLIVSVAAFLIIALWMSALLENRLHQSTYLSRSLQVGLAKTARLALIILAFLLALNTIGIDLTALAVFGGALGVGLGFGLQRIASNFISGFILLFDRSIRPGDVISVGESYGWVSALHARYVVIKDRDGVERLIPNENIITSEVTNWSYSDRNVRIKIPIQISYSNDPEQAMALMEVAARDCERILNEPPPVVRLIEFGENGINLELRAWVSDPEEGIANIRSEINLNIWRAFLKHDISIPFPQRDVHLFTQKD